MFDYWDYSQNHDILSPLAPMFHAGDCFLRDDKIYIPMATGVQSPWIHAKVMDDANCHRYQKIYEPLYGMIPKRCFRCWKVVQRPRNIAELFEIEKYQKEMRVPSKCGIETRQYVPANYGAYWYNHTKEEGLERLEIVRKDMPDIPAVLKRGCTEYEMHYGPSDQWEINPRALNLEAKLDKMLVEIWRHDGLNKKELSAIGYPKFVNDNIKRRWIEFAYERGDLMYLKFTKGQPIVPKVITYEPELETGGQVTKILDRSGR